MSGSKENTKPDDKDGKTDAQKDVKKDGKSGGSDKKVKDSAKGIKLQVGKLTRNINPEHLKELFGMYGTVTNAKVMMDPTVELSKGVGYIEFAERADAEKAVEGLHGSQLDGNEREVRES